MKNQRSKNQTFVGFWAEKSLVDKINLVTDDRAQFIRDAVAEMVEDKGQPVSIEERTRPSRAGKGGPKRRRVFHLKQRKKKIDPVDGAVERLKKRKPNPPEPDTSG